MTPITKEEWDDWKRSKVTQEFISRLNDQREQYKEGLADGEATQRQEQDIIIGRCQGLKDAIEYAWRHFDVINPKVEELNNA